MRSVSASAMVITMALCFLTGLLFFGGVNPDVAAPMFGLGFLAGFFWVAQLILCPDATWKRSPMNWPVLAFLAYAIFRYFTSPLEHKARIELFQIGLCALVYFIAANQFQRPKHRTWLIGVLIGVAVFESAFVLWQFATKSDAVFAWTRPEFYRGRGSGSYICPNNMAALLEMTLGLIAARASMINLRSIGLEQLILRKLISAYAALMAIGGILLTFSRTGWAATLVGLALLLFWGNRRIRFSWTRAALVLAAILLIGLAVWRLAPVRDYMEKSFTVQKGDNLKEIGLRDASIGGRSHMFAGTIQLIKERPILGSGIGTWEWVYRKYKHPLIHDHPEHTHNEYLNLTSDYGLVGFGLLLVFFIGFYRHALLFNDARLPAEQQAFAIGSAISVTALLVHSCFDFPLHIPANSVLLALITGSMAAMEDSEAKYPYVVLKPAVRYALAGLLVAGCLAGTWFYGKAALAAHQVVLGTGSRDRHITDKSMALEHYDRALSLDPRNPQPYIMIGDIYRTMAVWRRDKEKYADRVDFANRAIDAYSSALELNPFHSEVMLKMGQTHELIQQDAETLQYYLRSVEVDPGNAFNHLVLGRYYRDRGDTNAAYQEFQKSIQLNSWDDNQALLNLSDLATPPDETNAAPLSPSPAIATNEPNASVTKPPAPAPAP